jgi:hypothetical protein
VSESLSTKSAKDNRQSQAEGHPRQPQRQAAVPGPQARILGLQRTAGNQAVNQFLQASTDSLSSAEDQGQIGPTPATPSDPQWQGLDSQVDLLHRADAESSQPLDESVRVPIEQALGADLRNVRVHAGPAAEAAAESLEARAYTIGSDIYLGSAARQAGEDERGRLLAHETVHTVQQGGRPAALQGKMQVSQPGDRAEVEADCIAETIFSGEASVTPSPALALRNSLRASPVTSSIQRDITGSKKWPQGKFEINFTKNEAAAAGAAATEDGTVTFTPSKTAPESDSIRFVQIVRTFDTSTGDEFDWTGTAEANRNKMRTTRNNAKNIAPGFYVDQIAASLAKRTKKADPAVLPYYDAMLANPGNKIGKRKGKTIEPAVLDDHPGFSGPLKFNFVTSAKAADTGTWYGTVLWGFETFLDKAGVAKIKNEYRSFRTWRGETTDEALRVFDEFYQNPGSTTAPKK